MVVSPSEIRSGRAPAQRLVAAVIATFALVLGPLAFVPAYAGAPAVSGVVTAEGGGALEGVTVTLAAQDASTMTFDPVDEAETDEEGAYSFVELTTGTKYQVSVESDDEFAAAISDTFTFSDAKTVNLVRPLAGSISGTVKEAVTNVALEDVTVLLYPMNGGTVDVEDPIVQASETDGTYAFAGLTAGNYKVKFEDFEGNHLPSYYKNSSTLAGATTVVVNKTFTTSLDDVSLVTGSTITGSITNATGSPIDGASVLALPLVRGEADYDNGVDAVIEANGNYTISGLSAGAYKVQFSANDDTYLDEFYNNQPTEETADVLNLGTAATRSLGRTVMEAPANLTGIVKNKAKKKIEGVTVELFKVNGGVLAKVATDETYTEDDGAFGFEELFAGTYRLKLTDDEGRYKSRFSSDITIAGGSIRSAGVVELTEVPKKAATVKVVGKGGKKKVTLTITVKAPGVTPTGKVTIKLGTKKLKTVNLKKGKATVTLTKQKKGKRAYKVIYSGDAKVLTKTVTSKKITIK